MYMNPALIIQPNLQMKIPEKTAFKGLKTSSDIQLQFSLFLYIIKRAKIFYKTLLFLLFFFSKYIYL